MLRILLWIVAAVIAAQTLSSLVDGDMGNGLTGLFLTPLFVYGAYAFTRRHNRKKNKNSVAAANNSGDSRQAKLQDAVSDFKKALDQAGQEIREMFVDLKKAFAVDSSDQPKRPKASAYSASAVSERKYEPAMAAARRLRKIATVFEDRRNDVILNLQPMRVTRGTKSQNYSGQGGLIIRRDSILVGYSNERSRNPQMKQLDKKWSQTLGVIPTSPTVYYPDHSYVEFEALNVEDHILFSAFWQVLGGNPMQLEDYSKSDFSSKLRTAASFVEENRESIIAGNGALNLDNLRYSAKTRDKAVVKGFVEPKVGSIIEGYKLIKELAEGGYGKVFLAQQVSNKNNFTAIKLLKQRREPGSRPGQAGFMRQAEEFLVEAKNSLNFTSSPYVMTAHDMGMYPWPWIAYPLVRGGTVRQLSAYGTLPDREWWDLAHDLVSGLDSIHREGLVHLDIKPDNIMRDEDRFMIMDLGVSVVSGYEFGRGMVGSLPYMAPEILEARRESDFSFAPTGVVDVFSAGLTLLWGLTGRYHVDASTLQKENIEEQIYQSLMTKGVELFDISLDKRILLSQMLQIDPNKRASASDLLFEIVPHVDMEQKIRHLEVATSSLAKTAFEELEGGVKVKYEERLEGPLKSWIPFQSQLRNIIEEIRPAFFNVDIFFNSDREWMYVQALYAAGGWVMECQSEVFGEMGLRDAQKLKLLELGWNPPTDSGPNYERIEDMVSAEQMTALFVDALEQAYEITLAEISHFEFTIQNKNAY